MVEVRNLTKRYGQHLAVDNVSFSAGKGEIAGFLGPNGAGKTTTMNIITGYISATDGSVTINGHDILTDPEEAKKNIGYMPDNPPLYQDMTVNEYLSFVCDLKSVKKDRRKKMLDEIKSVVKIADMGDRLCKNLSKGYRQRVGLAQALVGYPDVLILDEPTVGLDPKQIIEMRSVIKNLGKKHTVILSSHILNEVSMVCDKVIIINKGVIVVSESLENLSQSALKWDKLLIRIKGDKTRVNEVLAKTPGILSSKPVASREIGTFDYELEGADGADIRDTVFESLATAGLPIYMMRSLEPTLEDIFLRITAGEGEPVQW